jgi:AraC-like DNA-binding protein
MVSLSLQSEFFARMADPQGVREVFEHLPGVFFFVKDDQGRHIAANSATFQRFGIKHERELIGTTDEKWFPSDVAEGFRRDDHYVISTGKPLINRLELWYDEQRKFEWFLCNKLPVRDRSGKVIGVMGVTRRDEKRMMHHEIKEATTAVNYLRENVHRKVTVADLAKALRVSERQLHRKLHTALGVTPHELMLRIRIQSAAEALAKTSDPISNIALDHGFCDHSAFTQQFRKRTGLSPKQFRTRHQA